jgi:hypothetical protein
VLRYRLHDTGDAMTDRELMQMALDALEQYKNVVTSSNDPKDFGGVVDGGKPARNAIQALRDRLAKPDREWVELTNDEVFRLSERIECCRYSICAAEEKLKEKNSV